MIIKEAPQALLSKVATPTRRGANIWREIVAPVGRSISISLEKLDKEITGLLVDAVLANPLIIRREPSSSAAVVLIW